MHETSLVLYCMQRPRRTRTRNHWYIVHRALLVKRWQRCGRCALLFQIIRGVLGGRCALLFQIRQEVLETLSHAPNPSASTNLRFRGQNFRDCYYYH